MANAQTINSFPHTESFEAGSGYAFNNVTGDHFDWTRKSGSTSSASTGPSSAYDGSYYQYIESSSPNYSYKTANLVSNDYDFTGYNNASFSFHYHMYGTSMGTLRLEVSTNGGYSWVQKWSRSGNQGNFWYLATVDLSSYSGSVIKLRFRGTTTTSYTSDMAVDKLTMTADEVTTPLIHPLTVNSLLQAETFDDANSTWVNQVLDDDLDWTKLSGATPTGSTGPGTSYEGNYYFYIESSSNYNKDALLLGPNYDLTDASTAAIYFNYHMYGSSMGTLVLQASTDYGNNWSNLWTKSGNQGNSWKQQTVSLNSYLGDVVSLRFKGTTGASATSDIALDYIQVRQTLGDGIATPSTDENYIHTMQPLTDGGLTHQTAQNIQYFDGLGRDMQVVQFEGSPDLNDIITSITYDTYGRQEKSYLPFAKSNNDGQYYDDYATVSNYTGSYGSTDDDYAYSQPTYEPAPLGRVEKQRGPGYVWRSGQNKEVKFEYHINGANQVRNFTVDHVENGTAATYYGANELTKNTTWDENTSQSPTTSRVEEFTDKLGRVVCKKVFDGATEHATYYVYDIYSNLRYVLPPKVSTSDGTVSTSELDSLVFHYQYDARRRMVMKKSSGCGYGADGI